MPYKELKETTTETAAKTAINKRTITRTGGFIYDRTLALEAITMSNYAETFETVSENVSF